MPIGGISVSPSPFITGSPSKAPTTETQKAVVPPPHSSKYSPQQTSASAWEEMEYGGLNLSFLAGGGGGGLDHQPRPPPGLSLPSGVIVKNTFLACPNMRSPSLDEEYAAFGGGWKSCPASGILEPQSWAAETWQPSEIQSAVISEHRALEEACSFALKNESGDGEKKELIETGELPKGVMVKNTFIDFPNLRSASLDEYMENKGWNSCPVSRMPSEVEQYQVSPIQSSVTSESAFAESVSGSSEEGRDQQREGVEATTTLRLLDHLPKPTPVFSIGSMPHQMGHECKPCGFVHKPEGCSNGANCQYCHLCPPGTIKQRKKVKKVMIRQVLNNRRAGYWF